MSYSAGAPPGYSGSPFENTCAESTCHTDTPTEVFGWIESNIPNDGFIADSTYSITVSAIHIGAVRFGFCLSPQDAFGNLQGELLNFSDTQLRGLGKYVTHKPTSINAIDSTEWSFEWVAPNPAPDSVIFYCCFNAANGDGQDSGDKIYTCSLIVKPKISIPNATSNIAHSENDWWYSINSQTLYLNSDHRISKIEIFSMRGVKLKCISNPITQQLNLPKGAYIVIAHEELNIMKTLKIVI